MANRELVFLLGKAEPRRRLVLAGQEVSEEYECQRPQERMP